ncbi:MAG: cyclic nucleotide-binding domain-containing protein [Candidatus Gracilibacteria bacterium]|nr:cyclic nucleotide-binding domain-containing protein [Candidatus Gracilibacteria bacterium]
MSFLNGVSLFSSLTAEEKKSLEMFCQERSLSNGEILFNEGDEAQAMYIVKEGELEVSKGNSVLGIVKKDGLVGEMALFEEPLKRRMASVKSISSETEIIVLLYFSIKEMEKKNPIIIEKIKNIITQRKEQNKNRGL